MSFRVELPFPNSRWADRFALAFVLVVAAAGQGTSRNQKFGFVNLTTARAAQKLDSPGIFLGGVVIRFFVPGANRESFAMSDKFGVALVPLRPGKYCAEAF